MSMKVFRATLNDRTNMVDISVEGKNIVAMALVLQESERVSEFYIDGLNVPSQPAYYGIEPIAKWKSPIQQ